MKIKSKIDEMQKVNFEYALKDFIKLHNEYHNTNSCDDLVRLSFDIGVQHQYYLTYFNQIRIKDGLTYRFLNLYHHLLYLCERKAFRIFNQG